MSMTLEEKVEVWQAQQWFRIRIIEDDEVIQEAYVKELPKWNGISGEVDYSYFGVDWHSTTQVGLDNVTFWGEVQIYQFYSYAGSDLENGSVYASHSTWVEDEHHYQSFGRPCQLEVTPVYLIEARLQWFGPYTHIAYNGSTYFGRRCMMTIVLSTEDMEEAEVVKVGADDQLLGFVDLVVDNSAIEIGGWRAVYKYHYWDGYDWREQDRADIQIASTLRFPYSGISLDVNQAKQLYIVRYDTEIVDGEERRIPVYATYKTPLTFEPIATNARRIRLQASGFESKIASYPETYGEFGDSGDYVYQTEPLKVVQEDTNRFDKWEIKSLVPQVQEFPSTDIPEMTVREITLPNLNFSIPSINPGHITIWDDISFDDTIVAVFSDDYFYLNVIGGDETAYVVMDNVKGRFTVQNNGSFQSAYDEGEHLHFSARCGERCQFVGFFFDSPVSGECLSDEAECDYDYDSSDFHLAPGTESKILWALFRANYQHVKLVVTDDSWGEADILLDATGERVLDEDNEADLIFGRTYRFKAASKSYGQFLGWHKPGPNYQYDPTDIVPFSEDYENAEILFIPQEASDLTLIAKFDEPKRYNVVTVATHDPSVTGGCTVSVAEGNHPSGAEAGVYFHGPLTVRGDANVGWRLVAWKINNVEVAVATEEEPCNEFLSFILGDEGTIDENDTCTVEGVFEADKFDVDLDTDEHSANKGTVTLKVSSDYGATYTTTTQRTDILAGSYLRVSVKANTGSAFRRIEVDGARIVAMPDTGDSGTYNYDFRLFKDVKVRAFFGATVTVAAKKKSSGTVSDETNGRVAASLSKTGPWDSVTCDFTYGEKVWIKAINSEAENATAYFNSWHSSSDSTLTAPLPKYGPLIDVTETGNATYWAKFSPQKLKVGIRITNDGDPQYGDIRVLTGGNDTYLVEVSQSVYQDVIADYFDETSTANIQPYSPAGSGIDRYYVTNQGDTVRLVCEVNNADQYPFDHFGRKHYLSKTSMTSTEEEIEADEIPRFVVYANVEIFTRYQTSTPHNVIVRYATGSGRAMGGFDLAPVGVNGKMKTDALVTADYRQGNTVEVSATVKNGYKFVGWYSDAAHNTKLSGDVIYQFTMGDSEVVIFAAFAASESRVFIWEGTTENKTMVWRSRRAVLPQALNMVVAAVHADGYPLDLKVHHASSPDPEANGWHDAEIEVKGQDARRLPIARAGKYVEVEVVSAHAVTRVAVGSSMQGLLG